MSDTDMRVNIGNAPRVLDCGVHILPRELVARLLADTGAGELPPDRDIVAMTFRGHVDSAMEIAGQRHPVTVEIAGCTLWRMESLALLYEGIRRLFTREETSDAQHAAWLDMCATARAELDAAGVPVMAENDGVHILTGDLPYSPAATQSDKPRRPEGDLGPEETVAWSNDPAPRGGMYL